MASPPPKRALTLEDIPGAPSWVEGLLGPLNTALRASADSLAQGLTFRENFAGEVRQVEVTCPEDWVTVTLASGWTATVSGADPQSFSIRKTVGGDVQVRGRLNWTGGGTPPTSQSIAALGSTYAPSHREVFDTYATNGATYTPATISINASGALLWETGGFANLSLSGDVWWTAGDRRPPRWTTPVDVRLGTKDKQFPGRPGYVLALGCRALNNPTAPVVVTGLDWVPINLEKQRNAPGVRLHRVWGLVPGTTYTLTLLVLPE